jgi:predicted O-methyltransferase YrrM
MLPETVYNIYGFLSPDEAQLLYKLASEVPAGGTVVEIGSFQGKSTVALGLGAKRAGAWVWAVDPHDDYQVNETTHYGMENHAALLKNLVEFGVADTVHVVALPSVDVINRWTGYSRIDLLWIDGCHDYLAVQTDLAWSNWMSPDGKIALHDSSGHYPDVTRALNEFLADGKWHILEQVDATTVLGRR